MRILYIGAGFVGACSAAVSAGSGHTTLVYDIDEEKIKKLGSGDRESIESCLFEEGLGDLLARNKERISFTTDYADVEAFLDACDAIFLCLPTPEIGETGESDLQYYEQAAARLAEALVKRNNGRQAKYVVIVNKSTVPISMSERTKEILENVGVQSYGIVSNPEFLVEGKAIQGSLKPDRVVVGAWNKEDFEIMRRVYQRFFNDPQVVYIEVNPKEAAAGKLLANFYLFNKLALCFDVIGRTSEAFSDVNFENLRRIITTDKRIGTWGFYDSLYAGGSCFIKDARSLSHQLQTSGKEAPLVNETYLANKRQLELFFSRAKSDAGFYWPGKVVALIGTAFKRDTNDVRNSAAVELTRMLLEQNIAHVNVYDPSALSMFERVCADVKKIVCVKSAIDALQSVDVVIIATDWPEFRSIPDALLNETIMNGRRPLIMDGRRMFHHRYAELQEAGFDIIAVGSPFLKSKK